MSKEKRYVFEVDSYENNEIGGWTKVYTISRKKSDGKVVELKKIEEPVSRRFFKYLVAVNFNSDKEAIDWFDSHYKGY